MSIFDIWLAAAAVLPVGMSNYPECPIMLSFSSRLKQGDSAGRQ
jgi:hypothetical protein